MLAVSVLHELGGRGHVLAGPDGPVLIVDVELGGNGGEIHVGLPERIHRAHVAPVGALLRAAADAGHAERVGVGGALLHHPRDHVHAEIVVGGRVGEILFQQLVEVVGLEDVDPHGGQRGVGLARHSGWIGGFFDEGVDLAIPVHRHHPEGACLIPRHLDTGHRDPGPHVDVIEQHGGVIHLVDVIPRQHHHIPGAVIANDVQVLVDRIGGAAIPGDLVHPLLGGQQVDEFVHLVAQKGPAGLQVAQQAVGFVLGHHSDPANAGVDAVGEYEVDDAELAAEVYCRFRPVVRQLFEATAPPSCENQGHGLVQQLS